MPHLRPVGEWKPAEAGVETGMQAALEKQARYGPAANGVSVKQQEQSLFAAWEEVFHDHNPTPRVNRIRDEDWLSGQILTAGTR